MLPFKAQLSNFTCSGITCVYSISFVGFFISSITDSAFFITELPLILAATFTSPDVYKRQLFHLLRKNHNNYIFLRRTEYGDIILNFSFSSLNTERYCLIKTVSFPSFFYLVFIQLQDTHECTLWNLYVSNLTHSLLSFFLLFKQFLLT